ncbi:U2 small nuclear ribonucleoprotein A' [Olea europaea var. sylvestris]|uniref:U2 small nuclear ribonucleoprotein A' n=1 Tax=Olea europaea var. sylvestris TaxID=158386 RepID=UPI000C1D1C3E|nr:U2 small nuclear ribonucleoprotein A' [Olea europaea var. sylvestris]
MVRLTADLIWKSPHFFNAIRERELDLRGNKIAVIENVGATEDQFDTIDLSDNEIVKLENFPYLNRLGTLLLNNNRITRINPNLGEFLPNIYNTKLCLIGSFHILYIYKLNRCSMELAGDLLNEVRLRPPKITGRALTTHERMEANNLFASKEAEEEAKKESVKTFVPGELPSSEELPKEEQTPKPVAPTPEQIIAIKAAIVNSQTLEEVARLEEALRSGLLPADLNIDGDTMAKNGSVQDDTMITDAEKEANDEPSDKEPKQKDDGPAEMEQE